MYSYSSPNSRYLFWVAIMVLVWILLHIIGDGTSNDLLQTGEDGLDCLLR